METLELIKIDNADYSIISGMIDKYTEGEKEEFDVCYTKGYIKILIKGIAYREFEIVTGTSFYDDDEELKECTYMGVEIDDVSAIDETGDYVECDFDVEKLKQYFK